MHNVVSPLTLLFITSKINDLSPNRAGQEAMAHHDNKLFYCSINIRITLVELIFIIKITNGMNVNSS